MDRKFEVGDRVQYIGDNPRGDYGISTLKDGLQGTIEKIIAFGDIPDPKFGIKYTMWVRWDKDVTYNLYAYYQCMLKVVPKKVKVDFLSITREVVGG